MHAGKSVYRYPGTVAPAVELPNSGYIKSLLDLLTSVDVFSLSRPAAPTGRVGRCFPSRSELLCSADRVSAYTGWHTSGQLYHCNKAW